MIEEYWSTLTPATQITYWGYICLITGFILYPAINYLCIKAGEYLGWIEQK